MPPSPAPPPHQQSLSDPSLSSRECVCVVAAIGSVLSTLPLSDLVPPLESLVSSRVERLQELAGEDPAPSNKPAVEKELDVLGALCHHIYPELGQGERHPVVLLLIQLFPAVQLLVSKWCTDSDIIEVRGQRERSEVRGRERERESELRGKGSRSVSLVNLGG